LYDHESHEIRQPANAQERLIYGIPMKPTEKKVQIRLKRTFTL
jgi:hypothetical protein